MGYNTRHNLEVICGDDQLISVLVNENEDVAYAIDSDGECCEECKWYDHEVHLRAFSEEHPGTLFKLTGEGEESGDIWAEYYKGGKMQRCLAEIVFPDFCSELLK